MPCAFPSAPSNPRRMCKAHQLSKFGEMGGNLEEVSWTPEKKDDEDSSTDRAKLPEVCGTISLFGSPDLAVLESIARSTKATSILLLLPLSITLYATTCCRTRGFSYGAIHPGILR
jgi:hypothetical protein